MKDARKFQVEKPIPMIRFMHEQMQEAYEEAANAHKSVGIPTKDWEAFNEHFGGVRSELITITGDTGSGKSTFARCWLHEVAKSGVPTLMVSLEDTINATIINFAKMIVGLDPADHTKEQRKQVYDFFHDNSMGFLDFNGSIDFDVLEKVIHMAAKEYQAKFIIVDHFDYLLATKEIREMFGLSISDIKAFMIREIKAMSKALDIGIAVVVHPSKLGTQGVKRREVGLDEMKGTSAFKQESDTVLSVFRPLKDDEETVPEYQPEGNEWQALPDPRERMYVRAQKIRHGNYAKNMNIVFKFLYDTTSGRIVPDRFVKKGQDVANKEVHFGTLEEWS